MQRYMRGMSNGGCASSHTELTNDQLRAAVPSIFAEHPHESRSERFTYIPTVTVLDGLRKEGFKPFMAQQGRSRIPGKADFTKHMMRLRHESRKNSQGEAFEIILINAHDGTSSYQMMSGVFRFVCTNGLFTGDTFDQIKVGHRGDVIGDVIEGCYKVLDDGQEVMEAVDEMKSLTLNTDEQRVFAEAAHSLRWEETESAPIEPARLLNARRSSDHSQDLWATFNRTQENVLKGGQSGIHRMSNGRRRRRTVREIKGLDQTKAVNRALWQLAEGMLDLKAAA